MSQRVVFVGGGNMTASLVSGLLATGHVAHDFAIVEPLVERRAYLNNTFAVNCYSTFASVEGAIDAVVLAVKPQVMRQAIADLNDLPKHSLVLSVAAGITLKSLQRWLNSPVAVVRCMPNTPALIGHGMSALYAPPEVTQAHCELAESLVTAVGKTLWVEREALLDAVTAISGSGPAYFFLVVETLVAAGQAIGLSESQASTLAKQTALGAAKMMLEQSDNPAQLRAKVTSKGGTTAAALEVLENANLATLMQNAVCAANLRAQELGIQLGGE